MKPVFLLAQCCDQFRELCSDQLTLPYASDAIIITEVVHTVTFSGGEIFSYVEIFNLGCNSVTLNSGYTIHLSTNDINDFQVCNGLTVNLCHPGDIEEEPTGDIGVVTDDNVDALPWKAQSKLPLSGDIQPHSAFTVASNCEGFEAAVGFPPGQCIGVDGLDYYNGCVSESFSKQGKRRWSTISPARSGM